jgi:hypothetical protein
MFVLVEFRSIPEELLALVDRCRFPRTLADRGEGDVRFVGFITEAVSSCIRGACGRLRLVACPSPCVPDCDFSVVSKEKGSANCGLMVG